MAAANESKSDEANAWITRRPSSGQKDGRRQKIPMSSKEKKFSGSVDATHFLLFYCEISEKKCFFSVSKAIFLICLGLR